MLHNHLIITIKLSMVYVTAHRMKSPWLCFTDVKVCMYPHMHVYIHIFSYSSHLFFSFFFFFYFDSPTCNK